MKQLSLVLNIVLLVAVSVLFYLHFSSTAPKKTETTEVAPVGDLTVAFVNSDSLIKKYTFIKDRKEILEAKGKKLSADLQKRAEAIQSDIGVYQRTLNNMTINQKNSWEEDLAKKQQNFQLFEQRVQQEMYNDQNKIMTDLYAKLQEFLKTYCEENNVQVVVKFDLTSDVLYGKPSLDITEAVIAGLNESYEADKNGTKTKADTTAKK